MPDELEIVDVQLSPPRSVGVSSLDRDEPEMRIDIAITVRNPSSQATLHAICSLRTLRFDPSTETLFVGLSEPEQRSKIALRHLSPPRMTPVLPGETKVIEVTVPRIIKKISSGVQLVPGDVEIVDISNLRHVSCSVSFSETPFRAVASQPASEAAVKLRQWGRTTVRTFERTIPYDQSPDSY